jgi:RNA polymerase sigma-70 factor (ECF subfamily)
MTIMLNKTTFDPALWLNDYGDSLYHYALLRVRCEATAEELVQDTLLAGLQSLSSFNEQSTIKTWLFGIMKYKVLDYFRHQYIETQSLESYDVDELFNELFDKDEHWQENVAHWKTPEKTLQNEQFWQIYQQCLERLPENMVTLFVLRMVDELSIESCCQILKIETTNQLYVALSRTRLKLRQCLDTYWFTKE